MILLTIRLKYENRKYTVTEQLPDTYNVSKSNSELQKLVEKTIEKSALEGIDDVIVTAKFEW